MNVINWRGCQRYNNGGKEAHKEENYGKMKEMDFRDDDRARVFFSAAWTSIPEIKPHSDESDDQTNHKTPECSLSKKRNEPRYEKNGFSHMRKQKTQNSCAVTAQLISAYAFAIRIVQFLDYLNPRLNASSHLLWLYSPVCVGKPRRPVFSLRGSNTNWKLIQYVVEMAYE